MGRGVRVAGEVDSYRSEANSMTQLGNLVSKTFASISGTYRIVRDTKPAGRDYQHGDERAIEHIDGQLAGETIEQVFVGPSSTGGWIDV